MKDFDFNAPAELYPARSKAVHRAVGYRRFQTAARALQFAIEEMPAAFLLGAVLETEEQRFDGADIRALYASGSYPLTRKASDSGETR